MSSKASEESYLSPKSWTSGNHRGSEITLPGSYPPSPRPQQHDSNHSAPQSLSAAVKARKSEYVRKKTMRVKIGTWNVAAMAGTDIDLGPWFIGGYGVHGLAQGLSGLSTEDHGEDDSDSDNQIESVADQEARVARSKKPVTVPLNDQPAAAHHDQVDLYVLGLQEVIDVTSMTEAIKPYTDPNPAKKWKRSLRRALPKGYRKIVHEQLLGLLILVFASPELAPQIRSVSATSIGTGLMGYLGNKGAVSVRMLVGETTKMCFINCHLAAGADQAALARRNWDTNQILSRTRFSPVTDGEVIEVGEEKIGDEDFAFWFGDLNYRLEDIPGEDVRRLLLLHTQNEYDVENKSKRKIDSELGYKPPPSTDSLPLPKHHDDHNEAERPAAEHTAEPPLDPKHDPASLHTTIQSLLVHDQLRNQQRLGKAFHEGWREGPIDFLPTYKYDVGSVGMFDSGEKKRSPSWCDRILYRTRRDFEMYQVKAKQREEARKKDEAMKARGIDEATAEHDVLFNYDPNTDGIAYGDDYDEYDDSQELFHDVELIQSHDDNGDMIELNSYLSHQRILSSDHKPLDAVFTLAYDTVIPELKARVQQDVAKQLDKAENEARPSITLVVDHHSEEPIANTDGAADMNVVQFGEVRFGVKKTRAVTIANTGQITATFSFVERPTDSNDGAGVTPKWLELSIDSGSIYSSAREAHKGTYEIVLSPGETTAVELTIDVIDEVVHQLNARHIELEDVLVLRVENGRDHFIPVKGTWLPSVFGRTLDELVLVPDGGVRRWTETSEEQATRLTSMISAKIHHSAPKELYTLTEIIPVYIERSTAEWEMLHGEATPPWHYQHGGASWPFSRESWTFHEGEERSEMLAGVREALDSASPLDENFDPNVPTIVRLEVLAETLTSFLQSLRDGVIPADTWTEIETRLSSVDKAKVPPTAQEIQDLVMDTLSANPVHSVSLTFITFLLTRIINEMMSGETQAHENVTPTKETLVGRRFSRHSRASTRSSDSGTAPSTSSQEAVPVKRGLFPGFRRNRTPSISSASTTTERGTDPKVAATERRRHLIEGYVDVFAPITFRAGNEAALTASHKKVVDGRKKRVLEAFLSQKQV